MYSGDLFTQVLIGYEALAEFLYQPNGAGKAAQNLPPPKPNTLRELATRALEEDNNNPVGEILSILFGKRSSKPKNFYCFLLRLDLSSFGG